MSRNTSHYAWLNLFIVLVSFASTNAVHADTETVTLGNGITYEVETDRHGQPAGAENRQVEFTFLGASTRRSRSSDSPVYEWNWHARLKKRGTFRVTVTTPIDETVSTSFEVVGRGEVERQLFDSEEYPTLWAWIDEPEITWFPFVFSFEDTQSDNTFELTQWLRFDATGKEQFVRAAFIAAGAAADPDSGHAFTTTKTFQPIFDDRVWELGARIAEDNQVVLEYVLAGETVENWSELITVQSIFGVQESKTPEGLLSQLQQKLLEDCPNTMWNNVRQSENDIVVEWRTEDCVGSVDSDDQYEITRALSGPRALHRVAYTTKRQPYLSDSERNEWIDRVSRAELFERVGVADNAERNYPIMPTRAILVEGGSVAVQAGLRADPEAPRLPFGSRKYPVRFFVSLINETDNTVWYQMHWYFPHKRKDRVKQKSAPVRKLEAGKEDYIWWTMYGVVTDKNHPIKIVFSSDEEQQDVLHTEETHMLFATADVDYFKQSFDELVSHGSGRLPMISGWPEMNHPKSDIPGTVTDAELQQDIQISLWKEESKKYRDCEHETLRAESVDDENGAGAVSEDGRRDPPVSNSQNVLREIWLIRSCDVTSKYEVLLSESSDGAAEIEVTKIRAAN